MKKAILLAGLLALFVVLGSGLAMASENVAASENAAAPTLEATESAVSNVSDQIGAFYTPRILEISTEHHRPLCIEPSPCQTSADCGVTIEGFNGVCLWGSCICP